jgi:hypothetical protein
MCGGNRKASVYTPASCLKRGTSEHPEELTDRCCLSTLAGLSKYLPLLGAWAIIAMLKRYVNRAFSTVARFITDHHYKCREESRFSRLCGLVENVDLAHRIGLAGCAEVVRRSAHVPQSFVSYQAASIAVHKSPPAYALTYPQSLAVIHRRSPLIHIFMLIRSFAALGGREDEHSRYTTAVDFAKARR